jgi:protein-disulfide isomerase
MLSRCLARLAAFLLIAAPVAALLPAAAPAAPATDWTRTVTAQPDGGFLVGNPAAKTRLIEYFSYTCPHCAAFAGAGTTELKAGWVKNGLIAIEYRNFVRDGFDLTASLVAHCGGAPRFLARHEAIFANYENWMKQAQTYAQSHQDAPQDGDRSAQFIQIADSTGLTALAGKQGLTPDAVHKCLADKELLSKILALTAGVWDADPKFEGTPGFLINGKAATGAHDWAKLKPLLPAPNPALPTPRK